MEVYKFGALNGYVLIDDRQGKVTQIPVDWKLDWD